MENLNIPTKICNKCKEDKPLTEFYIHKSKGRENCHYSKCKECERAYAQTEKSKMAHHKYVIKYRDARRAWKRKYQAEHPEIVILQRVRQRAKADNLEFNLELSDINIPEFCPIFGIKLVIGGGARSDVTPSIDRIDNTKGYIKGNIRIISWKANRIKNDASLNDIEKIYLDLKEYLSKSQSSSGEITWYAMI